MPGGEADGPLGQRIPFQPVRDGVDHRRRKGKDGEVLGCRGDAEERLALEPQRRHPVTHPLLSFRHHGPGYLDHPLQAAAVGFRQFGQGIVNGAHAADCIPAGPVGVGA
ncbi:hypothetical protein D3C85_1640200 [compost metagenome]